MARLGVPSPHRLLGLPADVIGALRMIPELVESTRAIERNTALLRNISGTLDRVSVDTKALPEMRDDMARIAETTSVLGAMDERIARLNRLMEEVLAALNELRGSVAALQGTVEPVGRLASRMPGQRRARGR